MATAAHNRLNLEIIADCRAAARKLERAWGRGGDQGRKRVEEWDVWFQDLTYKIVDLKNEGFLADQAEEAALAAILALKRVPHWDHPDNIALIRSTLRMNENFDDYPKKQTVGFEESDDDM